MVVFQDSFIADANRTQVCEPSGRTTQLIGTPAAVAASANFFTRGLLDDLRRVVGNPSRSADGPRRPHRVVDGGAAGVGSLVNVVSDDFVHRGGEKAETLSTINVGGSL